MEEKPVTKPLQWILFTEKFLVSLCAIVLALMTLIVLVAVFFRYVLVSTISWTEEATRYMMVFVSLLGAALALIREEHVGLSILVDRAPKKYQKYLDILRYLFIGFFASIMLYYGYILTISSRATGQILRISMKIPMSVVPISGFIMVIILIAKSIETFGGDR